MKFQAVFGDLTAMDFRGIRLFCLKTPIPRLGCLRPEQLYGIVSLDKYPAAALGMSLGLAKRQKLDLEH